jgi:hypothetical protein
MNGVFNKKNLLGSVALLGHSSGFRGVLKFPFEPLSQTSPQAVSRKTVFLVAMTMARRCSEIQALCRHAPFLRIEADGVHLRTNREIFFYL